MPSLIDKSGNIAYYGHLSWGNFVDWLVTLCLGGIIALTTMLLGGVRPDSQVLLLPLFALLLVLHGLWLAIDREEPKRLSQVPLLFVPFVAWIWINVVWLSPTQWRGWYELIYALEVVIFLWVIVNNVRSRAHLWVLIVSALFPAGYAVVLGYFQFFQNSSKLANAYAEFGLTLSPEFLGSATGSFADPNSFAAFLLILTPALLIAGLVPRLSKILRILCCYIAVMLIVGIFLTLTLWSLVLLLIVLAMVPWVCFLKMSRRVLGSVLLVLSLVIVVLLQMGFSPKFQENVIDALKPEGAVIQLKLWAGALHILADAPLAGSGAGSFSYAFEQSPDISLEKLPITPHNDYLLIASEYGIVGLVLFLLPSVFVVWWAYRHLRAEPVRVKLKDSTGSIMPPTRFFLSIGLAGIVSFALCLFCTFIFYMPALCLYGVLFLAILIKSSFRRQLRLPSAAWMRLFYLCLSIFLAYGFYTISAPRIHAQALELHARQRLDQLVDQRVHVSGDSALLDEVISLYHEACLLDPENADVWIGLSAANAQRFFRNPANFEEIGAMSAEYAQRGIDISETYWAGWVQLGVAQALRGKELEAEAALAHALELAPNSSNAYYFWAAYLSHFHERQAEAIISVQRALEINPNHAAARRLQQKLLIL